MIKRINFKKIMNFLKEVTIRLVEFAKGFITFEMELNAILFIASFILIKIYNNPLYIIGIYSIIEEMRLLVIEEIDIYGLNLKRLFYGNIFNVLFPVIVFIGGAWQFSIFIFLYKTACWELLKFYKVF